ncbi:MAG TPA: beta-propeller fold lactonase family protein [Granulicella sp.]
MMLKNTGRIAKAGIVSLALGLGLTACSRDYTVAYVYATSAKTNPGLIDAYSVDFQSGALVQLADSPIQAGRNPVALATVTSKNNNVFLFVVNHDDSTVGTYGVGTDGKLYGQATYNTNGSFPVAAAVDATGSFLYVAYTYQQGFTTASPGPGGISIFPISYSGTGVQETISLGTPTEVKIGNNPVSIVCSKFHNFVYVVDAEAPQNSSPIGEILGFSENTSTGALTPLPGVQPLGTNGLRQYDAGVSPSGIAETPLASYVYVTDKISNQLIGYLVLADGSLSPMQNGPFPTGQYPTALTIDPRGSFLYVTNFNDGTVSSYSLNPGNGTPTANISGTTAVRTNPMGVTIEPALGIYLYTANQADGTISGEQLSPNNGTLKDIQHTPFPASGLPNAVISIANGQHLTSTSVTTPTNP